MRPPAASIFALALALTFTPRTVNAPVTSPLPSSLAGPLFTFTRPAANNVSVVTYVPVTFVSSSRRTI